MDTPVMDMPSSEDAAAARLRRTLAFLSGDVAAFIAYLKRREFFAILGDDAKALAQTNGIAESVLRETDGTAAEIIQGNIALLRDGLLELETAAADLIRASDAALSDNLTIEHAALLTATRAQLARLIRPELRPK